MNSKLFHSFSVGLIIVLMISLFSACSPATPAPSSVSPTVASTVAPVVASTAAPTGETVVPGAGAGTQIIVADNADINILDPHKMQATVDEFVWHTVFAGLTRFDATMANPTPEMAESWDRPDDLTYIFHLRKNVKWHSGRLFTADDVVWNWSRVQEIGKAGRIAAYMSDVKSVVKVDDNTVQFNLKNPSAIFLINTPLFVFVDKDTVDQIATNPIGTGAYRFVEWVPNDHMTLQLNKDYWDQSINRPDKLIFHPIPEDQTRLAALQTGEIDVAGNISPKLASTLKGMKDITVYTPAVSASYWVINMNVTQAPFDNVKVRQAVAAGIDREAIWHSALFDNGVPSCDPIPDSSWAYDKSQECGPRDVAKAKQLIADSGVKTPIQVTLKVYSTDPAPAEAQIIKSNLDEIGFDVTIQVNDFAVWLNDVWINKNFTITTTNYTRESDPDGLMSSVFRKGQGNNVMGYDNPKVDALFDQAKAIYDQSQRAKLYQEIVSIVLEDAPLVKIASNFPIWAARNRVQNLVVLPRGFAYFGGLTLAK